MHCRYWSRLDNGQTGSDSKVRIADHSECGVARQVLSDLSASVESSLIALEQCERNRIPLGAAACIVGMQMVSTVVIREQLRRVTRIAYNSASVI